MVPVVAFAAEQDAERNQAANASNEACSNAKRAKRIGEATVRAAITFQTKLDGKRAILAAEKAMLEACDFKVGDFSGGETWQS